MQIRVNFNNKLVQIVYTNVEPTDADCFNWEDGHRHPVCGPQLPVFVKGSHLKNTTQNRLTNYLLFGYWSRTDEIQQRLPIVPQPTCYKCLEYYLGWFRAAIIQQRIK